MAVTVLLLGGCNVNGPVGSVDLAGPVMLPFVLEDNIPIVEVTFAGAGPCRFLLDTGAQRTVLDERLARLLKLSATKDSVLAISGGGAGTARNYRLPSLEVGEARYRNLLVTSHDLGSFGRGRGAVTGLLGLDVFQQGVLHIDYPRRLIIIDPAGRLHRDDPGVVAAESAFANLMAIPLEVGGSRFSAVLDTGNSLGLVCTPDVAARLPLAFPASTVGFASSPHGAFPVARSVIAGDVYLAGQKLVRPALAVIHPMRLIGPSSLPTGIGGGLAMVGGGLLRNYVLSIDPQRRLVRLQGPGAQLPQVVRAPAAPPSPAAPTGG